MAANTDGCDEILRAVGTADRRGGGWRFCVDLLGLETVPGDLLVAVSQWRGPYQLSRACIELVPHASLVVDVVPAPVVGEKRARGGDDAPDRGRVRGYKQPTMRQTAIKSIPVPETCRESVAKAVTAVRFMHGRLSPSAVATDIVYDTDSQWVTVMVSGYTTVTRRDVEAVCAVVSGDAYLRDPTMTVRPRDPGHTVHLRFGVRP